MALDEDDPEFFLHHDNSSIASTAITPPSTVTIDPSTDDPNPIIRRTSSFLVPWPGATFIIRSISSGQMITLLHGQIVLTQPGDRGSTHWECVESEGWLGFRNVVSGRFLGHDKRGRLRCLAERHQSWEYFCARMRPDGGCVLLMTHYEKLWRVGMKVEDGAEKLMKFEDGAADEVVWEFIRV